jgi:hypothetical protein
VLAEDIGYCFLNEVRSFVYIYGMIYDHTIVEILDILFSVVYFNGNGGIVRGGSWVHGEGSVYTTPLFFNFNICAAKEHAPSEDLLSIHIGKEEMLRIALPPYLLAENPSIGCKTGLLSRKSSLVFVRTVIPLHWPLLFGQMVAN